MKFKRKKAVNRSIRSVLLLPISERREFLTQSAEATGKN